MLITDKIFIVFGEWHCHLKLKNVKKQRKTTFYSKLDLTCVFSFIVKK
jgi:hypothetical protein